MLTTCGTVVRRVGHQEVNRATGAYMPKVVQGALVGCVARGEMPTSGAGSLLIVTAIKSHVGCWEVLDVDNALGGVWHVFTPSKHGWLPWKKGWDRSIKVITCPVYIESRIPATVSCFTPNLEEEAHGFKGTHLRRDTVIPQWFQASKAAAASDGHAVHF